MYDRHRPWCADSAWDRILTSLQVKADAKGCLDWSLRAWTPHRAAPTSTRPAPDAEAAPGQPLAPPALSDRDVLGRLAPAGRAHHRVAVGRVPRGGNGPCSPPRVRWRARAPKSAPVHGPVGGLPGAVGDVAAVTLGARPRRPRSGFTVRIPDGMAEAPPDVVVSGRDRPTPHGQTARTVSLGRITASLAQAGITLRCGGAPSRARCR